MKSKKVRVCVYIFGVLAKDETWEICRKSFNKLLNKIPRDRLKKRAQGLQISSWGSKQDVIDRIYRDPRTCTIIARI